MRKTRLLGRSLVCACSTTLGRGFPEHSDSRTMRRFQRMCHYSYCHRLCFYLCGDTQSNSPFHVGFVCFFFVSLLLCFVGAVWVGDSVPRIMRGSHSTSPYSLSLCMFYISLVIPNVPCSPYCFFFVLFCDSYFITLNILTLVKFSLWWLVACFAYIFALRFACWRR